MYLQLENARYRPPIIMEQPTGISKTFSINGIDTAIPGYNAIRLSNIYDGIDILLENKEDSLRYYLVIHPNADITQIRIRDWCPAATFDGYGSLYKGFSYLFNDYGRYYFGPFGGIQSSSGREQTVDLFLASYGFIEGRGNVYGITLENYDPLQELMIELPVVDSDLWGTEKPSGVTEVTPPGDGMSHAPGFQPGRYLEGTWVQHKYPSRSGNFDSSCNLFLDSRGVVWVYGVGSWFNGVLSTDRTQNWVNHDEFNLATTYAWYLFEGKYGDIWVLNQDLLLRYDREKWESFSWKDVYSKGIYYRCVDTNGKIWFVASDYQSVMRFDGTTWKQFKDDMLPGKIWDIVCDQQGTIWFATDAGVVRFDGTTWRTFTQSDGLPYGNVRGVIADSTGGIWVSTDAGRVARYDGSTWNKVPVFNALPGHMEPTMIAGTNGTVWFACRIYKYYGSEIVIARYDGSNVTTYPGFSGTTVFTAMLDNNGGAWFSTGYAGEAEYHYKTVVGCDDNGTKMFPGNMPESNVITSVAFDEEGTAWCVTNGGGIFTFSPKTDNVDDSDGEQRQLEVTTYPNPFNPATTISYNVPVFGHVRLTVYSVTGQQVAKLVDIEQNAGSHSAIFEGSGLASGIYFYRLEVGASVKTGKMMMIK